MPQHYPFTAVVGSTDMTLALILTTVSPEIGGVLVRGEKGTAKSTAVRALAAVLPPIEVVAGDRFSSAPGDSALSPDGPFGADAAVETRPVRLVELPVGATEDRLLGSLHLEKALAAGVAEYEPGLLAKAHRGILYVDEVNLLHDHLVDLLLDAAAMGRATVERDNVSVVHAARFVLVGTMNPEEGELRPQLLDRFGLTVEIAAPREPGLRTEVVRRRLAYDADPDAFAARFADAEAALSERIAAAQASVADVSLGDGALAKIAEVCAAFDVDGLRADIVMARTAVAHAAWQGRRHVLRDDIRVAALLALPHRRRRNPFDAPGIDEDLLDSVLGDDEPDPEPPNSPEPEGPDDQSADNQSTDGQGSEEGQDDSGEGAGNAADNSAAPSQPEGSDGDDSPDPTQPLDPDALNHPPGAPESDDRSPGTAASLTQHNAGTPFRTRRFEVAGTGAGEVGKRSRAITSTGRRIGSVPGRGAGIDLIGTVRAAVPRQYDRGRRDGALLLRPDDLRGSVREGRESNLVLFCVDASGSMAARKRMQQVKTAILSLLLDAYQRRDKVGLVTFRGVEAEVALPPTGSIDVAARRLDELPAGGRTPLAEGLLCAADVIRREHLRDPRRRPLLVLVTDGRATAGADPVVRSQQAAAWIAEQGVETVVVDCEAGPFRLGLAARLAATLQATYLPVAEVSADVLATAARVSTGATTQTKGSRLMPKGKPSVVPDDGLTTAQRRRLPLLMVNTGDGKGKSTAAFGMALRAWNAGWNVGVFQFVKSAKWRIGEQTVLERLGELHEQTGEGGPVDWQKMGAGWSWSRKDGTAEDHARDAAEGWAEVKRRIAAEQHDLYVLDEFTYVMEWGWVDVDDVIETLVNRPGRQYVMITGRRAHPRLVEVADLVTEMGKVKHQMDRGQKGQQGVEW